MTQLITPKKKNIYIYLFSIYYIVKIVQITFIDTLICKCFVVQLIEILAFQYIFMRLTSRCKCFVVQLIEILAFQYIFMRLTSRGHTKWM